MKKGEIENLLFERKMSRDGNVVFKKSQLRLVEADMNGDDSIYVKPTGDAANSHSMGTDIQNAINNNPTENDYTVDPSEYDGGNSNNNVTFDINAKNGIDAQKQINKQMQNPQMKSLGQNGQLQANIHITDSKNFNDRLARLEEGVRYKKSELDKVLFGK